MKESLLVLAVLSILLSLWCVREASALTGFPPDFAFGRLVIADRGQTVVLYHPSNPNSGPLHLRLGLSNYTIVDAWWDRDGGMAKIMIHVVDEHDAPDRDMVLGQAYIG